MANLISLLMHTCSVHSVSVSFKYLVFHCKHCNYIQCSDRFFCKEISGVFFPQNLASIIIQILNFHLLQLAKCLCFSMNTVFHCKLDISVYIKAKQVIKISLRAVNLTILITNFKKTKDWICESQSFLNDVPKIHKQRILHEWSFCTENY